MKLQDVLAASCAAALLCGALVTTAFAAPGGLPGKPEKKDKARGFLLGTFAVTTDPLPELRPEVFVATGDRHGACPEQRVIPGADPACTGHVILMASPTMGTHVLCTAQDAASKLGFRVGPRDQMCPQLTAADGRGDPDEPLSRE